MTLVIDSITYDVPFTSISRKGDILFKYAERTENGALRAETIGTYYNFDLQAGRSVNNKSDYDAMWLVITSPNHEHEITLPNGDNNPITFGCYFSNASDDVLKWKIGNTTLFRALSFSVIALAPQRTP